VLTGWEPKAESALKDLAVVLKQQGRAADAAALITHYRPQVAPANPNQVWCLGYLLPRRVACALRTSSCSLLRAPSTGSYRVVPHSSPSRSSPA